MLELAVHCKPLKTTRSKHCLLPDMARFSIIKRSRNSYE